MHKGKKDERANIQLYLTIPTHLQDGVMRALEGDSPAESRDPLHLRYLPLILGTALSITAVVAVVALSSKTEPSREPSIVAVRSTPVAPRPAPPRPAPSVLPPASAHPVLGLARTAGPTGARKARSTVRHARPDQKPHLFRPEPGGTLISLYPQ